MMAALYNKIRTLLAAEHDRVILFAPVLMGFGVAWYFSRLYEPPRWLGAAALALAALTAIALRNAKGLRLAFIALACVAAGVTLAQYRTYSIHSPFLAEPIASCQVTGKIEEIAPTPKGSKLMLRDVTISGLTPAQTPAHVSITLRSYDPDLVTGQQISLHAGLFPPPAPALPGGFDFGRYFYFREVGAVGFAMGNPTAKSLKESGASDFDIWFAEFRHRLTESIRSYFHEPAGSVAAAFITGEVRAIPDAINDNMRIAGLYHLLAVSGMNLSVVAGLAFFAFRFIFAAIAPLARRYPIKKWAALLALLASYIYLRVSGSPVSAERAFFMVSLIFIAMLLDRDPMPMRSVAIAAFCILLYEPEAVLTASFQLSFSATAALIASYEWGIGRFAQAGRRPGFGVSRVVLYFAAVMAVSLVAWLATEPFIIYHFNQFSSYSLLANTIAEPLVSFILMPLVIAGVLLLPFHLAWIAFTPMQYGVDALLTIANRVAHLPHAMWLVPNPSDYGFAWVILGVAWIYFWRARWRWLGLLPVIAGMCTAFSYAPADLLISNDGKHVAARLEDGRIAILKGRAQNMTAQQWARAELQEEYAAKEDVPMQCDKLGCIITLHGHTIAIVKKEEGLADDCHSAQIVIIAETVAHEACPTPLLIDKAFLDNAGATAIRFHGADMLVTRATDLQGVRPWVKAVQPDSEY